MPDPTRHTAMHTFFFAQTHSLAQLGACVVATDQLPMLETLQFNIDQNPCTKGGTHGYTLHI